MLKNKVTREDVYALATKIVRQGSMPTHILLKSKLGKGSDTTIQKYFKQWKEECFKKSIANCNPDTANFNKITESYEFLQKKKHLEQALNKKIAQNELYAKELINAEKANIVLREENYQLQIANQELQLKLIGAEATNSALEQVTQKIQNELNLNKNKTIEKMQQTIDNLRSELKTLNETGIIALRETSTKGHDALMQEKVISINLQAKIDNLYKDLMDHKKQSHDADLKHQVQTQILLRQINWQQKIIQDQIGLEKLSDIVGEQELMLNFNNKLGAAYGK